MKYIKLLAAFAGILCLSSCLDTEERIEFLAVTSGTYSITMDLSRLFKVALSMGADKSNTDQLKEKKDTILYVKEMMTDNALTAAEKDLYKDGSVRVKLDGEKSEVSLVISTPFKNTAGLIQIKNNFFAVLNKLQALEKTFGKEEGGENSAYDMTKDGKMLNPLAGQFAFTASAHKISYRVIDSIAFQKFIATDSSLGMIRQLAPMMGDFNYRTLLILPVPAKAYQGPGSSILKDRKTIRFSASLTEITANPAKAGYEVTF